MEALFNLDRSMPHLVPRNHSSGEGEARKKIRKFQELSDLIRELERRKEDTNSPGLDGLISERKKEFKDLQEELREHESAGGEVYFMLGGDYGGGSFKLLLNRPGIGFGSQASGGFVIGEMEGKDTYENLKTVFGIYSVISFFVSFFRKGKKIERKGKEGKED